MSLLTCTFDSGQTWVGEGTPTSAWTFALAADGSALIVAGNGRDLDRLGPNASTPDELNPLPDASEPSLYYAGSGLNGAIWLISMTDTGDLAAIYTASYV
jgi:hypothetical protein